MKVKEGKLYGLVGLKLIFFLTSFLVCLQLMILSFKLLNASVVEQILIATSNPFVGLFIGILITALIHSSSTITSALVAIVASGTITLESAVYIVMGANIGTTVTSTLVSLGHVSRRKEFRKALAAATVHDFFNILTACILFPLEYYFGILSGLAKYITSIISASQSFGFSSVFSGLVSFIEPAAVLILNLLGKNEFLSLGIALGGLFLSIWFISRLFKHTLLEKSPNPLEKYLFSTPLQSFFFGCVITALVQSSTLVTSLIVPIVANNKLSIKRVFPFIMGANVGTTITALIASISKSDAALSIALTHLLFNVIGTLIFFPIPSIREIPVAIARSLGKAALRNRLVGFAYIILVFFVIPFFLIYFNKDKIKVKEYAYVEAIKTANFTESVGTFKINLSSPISNKRLFYLQTNSKNNDWVKISQAAKIVVKTGKNTLSFNQQSFYFQPIGSCWEGEDGLGKYKMCVTDIQKSFKLNDVFSFHNCYLYSKKYQTGDTQHYTHRIFLAAQEKIILKHEILDKNGKILAKEELVSILN